MNRTFMMFMAALCLAVTTTIFAVPYAAQAADEADQVDVWKCARGNPEGGYFDCWCLWSHERKKLRMICDEHDGGCWTDSGWNVLGTPNGQSLPDSYNSAGELLISVAPGDGGNFSGTGNPSCLAFLPNSSNLVIIPAPLLQ